MPAYITTVAVGVDTSRKRFQLSVQLLELCADRCFVIRETLLFKLDLG